MVIAMEEGKRFLLDNQEDGIEQFNIFREVVQLVMR